MVTIIADTVLLIVVSRGLDARLSGGAGNVTFASTTVDSGAIELGGFTLPPLG